MSKNTRKKNKDKDSVPKTESLRLTSELLHHVERLKRARAAAAKISSKLCPLSPLIGTCCDKKAQLNCRMPQPSPVHSLSLPARCLPWHRCSRSSAALRRKGIRTERGRKATKATLIVVFIRRRTNTDKRAPSLCEPVGSRVSLADQSHTPACSTF